MMIIKCMNLNIKAIYHHLELTDLNYYIGKVIGQVMSQNTNLISVSMIMKILLKMHKFCSVIFKELIPK